MGYIGPGGPRSSGKVLSVRSGDFGTLVSISVGTEFRFAGLAPGRYFLDAYYPDGFPDSLFDIYQEIIHLFLIHFPV